MMNRFAGTALLIATLAIPITHAQEAEDELRPRGPRDAPGMQRARPAPQVEQVSPQVESMQRMQRLLEEIERTSDPATRERLLAQHLRAMQEQVRLILAASPSIGVAMVRKEGAGGTEETVVFGEDKLCPGSASVHKLIVDRLNTVETLLQHIVEREAVQSGLVHNE
jgi:hypothetical protein